MKLWIQNGTVKCQGASGNKEYNYPVQNIVRYTPTDDGLKIYITLTDSSKDFYIDYLALTEYNDGTVPTIGEIIADLDELFSPSAGVTGAVVAVSNFPATQPISGTVTVVSGSGTDTPSITSSSVSVTIAAGAKSVTIVTNAIFAGTILGFTASASEMYSFTAQPGNTLAAIAIVITAGSVKILKTV